MPHSNAFLLSKNLLAKHYRPDVVEDTTGVIDVALQLGISVRLQHPMIWSSLITISHLGLDWKYAGFYPKHFEYASMQNFIPHDYGGGRSLGLLSAAPSRRRGEYNIGFASVR
jgi:hypothetical protein